MSKFGGMIKADWSYQRYQQKKDWKLLTTMVPNIEEPDWSMSIKKVDKFIEKICTANNIDFNSICGCG